MDYFQCNHADYWIHFFKFTIFCCKDHFNSEDYFKQFKVLDQIKFYRTPLIKVRLLMNIPDKDVSVLIVDNKSFN
jgi:hypothetical protein